MKTLTATQKELLEVATKHCTSPTKYDTLKSLCGVKSFDGSFNLLLKQGYFAHHPTNDYSNQFTRTSKKYNKW